MGFNNLSLLVIPVRTEGIKCLLSEEFHFILQSFPYIIY